MADPANLVVVVVDNDAALSWDGSPTPNVADYSVFRRSPSTGAVFNPAGTPIASGVTSLTYGDNNLPAGTYDWQVFGRVVAATVAPTITSPNNTPFAGGTSNTFTVTATGTPTPTLSMTGTLPAGVTFVAATGVLSGTPSAVGTFPLVFTAANGTLPNAVQNFTLTVTGAAPAITSAASTSFTEGTAGTFTVTKTGTPTPTLSMTGTLPAGVTFTPSTGVLAGTPTEDGTFPLVFTASNGITPNAVQNFTLTVAAGAPFVPTDLPNLVGWWDASNLSSIVASGGSVSQWNDLSGAAKHVGMGVGTQQPNTGVHTINSKNVLGFDGTSDNLAALSALTLGGNALTLLAVVQYDGAAVAGGIVSLPDASGSDYSAATAFRALYDTGSGTFGQYSTGVRSTIADTVGSPAQVTSRRAGTDFHVWKDGTLGTPASSVADNFAITGLRIGADSHIGTAVEVFPGKIAEIVTYAAALSDANRIQVQDYLKAKWATP